MHLMNLMDNLKNMMTKQCDLQLNFRNRRLSNYTNLLAAKSRIGDSWTQ
jgi:hypothetical protein